MGAGATSSAGARLLLLAPCKVQAREHVLAMLQQQGIASARVEFADKRPRPEDLKLYNRIDLCLDPVPCNGHTTSLDALWMGVPILTLVSTKTAMGRAGWSQLCNLRLEKLAATNPDEFVARVVALAEDLPRLQGLRNRFAAADETIAVDECQKLRARHRTSLSGHVAKVVRGNKETKRLG